MTTTAPAPPGNAPRGNLALGIVLGVVVGLVAVVLAWWGLQDQTTAQPAPSAPPATASTPTPTPSGTPTPTPTPTPTAHPDIVTALPSGSWITVLDSLSQSSTTPEQALARAQELSRPDYEAVVIDTNAFGSLNPGYYAVVIPGQASREEVNAVCQGIGVGLGDSCYPRQIG